jgi:hypothetical protein
MHARSASSPLRRIALGVAWSITLGAGLAVLMAAAGAAVSSRSYRGHDNDADMQAFVEAYRSTAGTRLDDCRTCHAGGTFTRGEGAGARTIVMNACDFCHLVVWPDAEGFDQPQPTGFAQTLNPYGADYAAAGRDADALRSIDGRDSDGDGFVNREEIAALAHPGDPASRPGQPPAPARTYDRAALGDLPYHDQFMLVNAHKQRHDFYALYGGVRIVDLLRDAGVDVDDPAFQGITVVAADGFLKDVSAARILAPCPTGLFHAGLDAAALGEDCGFVRYPRQLPAGLDATVRGPQPIPGEPWLMLAYLRDGGPLEPAVLNPAAGKIDGEGPFRLVVPQTRPDAPDRSSRISPSGCTDGLDYDDARDHNSGDMARGVVAIRVNPLPAGVEDLDLRQGGWAALARGQVLVYGFGVVPD